MRGGCLCYNFAMPESNPFYHRGPVKEPEFFFGREREVAYLFDLLRKGQSVALSGPRRIGKTSLLFQIQHAEVCAQNGLPADEMRFLCIDGGMLDGMEEDSFYAAMDRGLDGNRDTLEYAALLERLRAFFGNGARKLTVILDEFELVASNPRFGLPLFNRLRGLTSQYPIQFITASRLPLWQLTRSHPDTLSSPFFNIFAPMPLTLFEEEQARALLSHLSRRAGKAFSAESIRAILALAGPHPLFLQVAGYRGFEAAAADGVLPAQAWAEARRCVLADLEAHLGYYWNELAPDARYALAALPLGNVPTAGLEESGLVRAGGYTGEVVELFVRRQAVDGLLQAGPFLMDLRRSQTAVDGNLIHLTPTEFNLLKIFLEKRGYVLRPEEIESALWPDDQSPDPERARGAVKKLRAALGSAGEHLVNRRGQGYLLDAE
jgi:hypothetical protein